MVALEEGRRVRLLVDVADYCAGDTGYLHQWLGEAAGADAQRDEWGVVFDKDGDNAFTMVRVAQDGDAMLFVDVVELIVPPADTFETYEPPFGPYDSFNYGRPVSSVR